MAKRKRTPKDAFVQLKRRIDVDSVSARVSAYPEKEKGREPKYHGSAALELKGRLDEPIRDLVDVEVVVYDSDIATLGTEPLPWIGTVDFVRPVIRPVAFLPHRDFDRLWTLALTGSLKHVTLFMTPPRYQTAYIVNVSFTTDPEE